MNRRILGVTLLAAAMVVTAPSAFGFGKKKNDCNPCGMTAVYAAPCAPTITYVDKKVLVTEWVPAKEDYKYWVSEPETKKEKIKVKEMKWKDESYKYWVNEWVTVKEKVKVGEWKAKTKEVEVTLVDFKPKVTKQKRTVCEWVCVPVQVTCAAPCPPPCGNDRGGLFGRLCGKKRNDCAPPCGTPCPPPCPPPVVVKTVMQRQMVTREIEVDVTTYDRVERKEKRQVTSQELVWSEKEVEVKKSQPAEKTGTRKVAYWVDVEKEIDVVRYKQVEKTGTRTVMKPQQVEKTVKVAVCTPCAAPCPPPCPPCGMTGDCGSGRGGLFRGGLFGGRNRGGCCN